ncbi:hypothetical protein MVEG_11500 [Podila verticillata NRRL 6337]|uniref:Uncharacterized protein n=1 Tax=Podila verticillata NRRL 6337 TaxID=1069443 RepID=A0A086TK12_9FUNG|nr:hypothetical protein MVEG_11500 [Podila verticillata NRRL 6337]
MSTTITYPSFKPTFAPYHSTFTTPTTPTKPSSYKRRVRFTFGYNNNKDGDNASTRSSLSSSPSSPTLSFDQHFHKHSSGAFLDIVEKEKDSSPSTTTTTAPTAPDLIPTRTSSITSSSVPYSPTSHTFTPVPFTPTPSSRCSSMNSGVSFTSSLNHRTMPRPQHQATSSTENRNKRSHSPPATSRSSSPAHDLDTPSSKESQMRSAFLSSPPVRSCVTRRKICPIPSKGAASLITKCCPLSSINLDKRRWSNDSTRGLNGAFLIEDYESFRGTQSPSSPSHTFAKTKTNTKAVSHHGYLESPSCFESSVSLSLTEVSTSKKRCKTLSLFKFMKKA